jgi:hypothetical protein
MHIRTSARGPSCAVDCDTAAGPPHHANEIGLGRSDATTDARPLGLATVAPAARHYFEVEASGTDPSGEGSESGPASDIRSALGTWGSASAGS